jgi:hypothetical protein
VHDCVDAGGVPVQFDGEAVTVRAWLPSDWQAPHAPVVYVQAAGGGVHDCDSVGVPPVQPEGDEALTVRVWVPSDWQAPHAEYVNEVQVVTGGT